MYIFFDYIITPKITVSLFSIFFAFTLYSQNDGRDTTEIFTTTGEEPFVYNRSTLIQKITNLEESVLSLRQDISDAKSHQKTNTQILTILSVVAAFLAAYFTYDSQSKKRNDLRREEMRTTESREQINNLKKNISDLDQKLTEKEKEENLAFFGTVQNNINSTTDLMRTIQAIFDDIQVAESLRNRVNELETEIKEKTARSIDNLNDKAEYIFSKISRINYLNNRNSAWLSDFANEVRAKTLDYEGLDERGLILISLEHLSDNQLIDATKLLKRTIKKGKENNNDVIIIEALYHLGFLQFLKGRFKKAEGAFNTILENYDPKDVDSLVMKPLTTYYAASDSFKAVEAEFEKSIAILKTIEKSEKYISQLMVNYGDCFYINKSFQSSQKKPFQNSFDLRKAFEKYQNAIKADPTNILARLSYAQTLNALSASELVNSSKKSEFLAKSQKLFSSVIEDAMEQSERQDHSRDKIPFLYMLAISENRLKKNETDKAIVARYLSKTRIEAGNYSSLEDIKFYSPLTKNYLSYTDFIKETKNFEYNISVNV